MARNNSSIRKLLFRILTLAVFFSLPEWASAQSPITVSQPTHVTFRQSQAIWEGDFEYDANGLFTECILNNSNDSSHVQYTMTYDGNKNLEQYEKKLWGYTSRAGKDTRYPYMYKYLYKWYYDEDGRVTGIERYLHEGHNVEYWVTDGVWKPQYDEDGKLVGDSLFYGIVPDGYTPLVFKWSRQITYSNQERVTLFTHNEDTLVMDRITETYDTDGKLLHAIVERLGGDGFINSTMTDYEYEDGRLSTIRHSDWEDSFWLITKETRYVRNSSGEIVVTDYLRREDNELTLYKRTERELNSDGQPKSITFLDNTPHGWSEGTNIAEFPLTALPGHAVDTFFTAPYLKIHNMIFNHDGLSYLEFAYDETVTPAYDIQETVQSKFTISPNPVGDCLGIQFSPDVTPTLVELYDAQGRLVMRQTASLESVNTTGLKAGLYTVKVTLSDGKSYSDSVIKK